ncbi:polyisoprenoid-binding protein [Leptospira kobayashii]|uniref:Polyisoprenoid-binding protein n=1 Tax=Leptospira kobayashii TaxID=1917830 RepID=A0ABN6KE82_9LEPT|nr:YceI family protein [Leptospira kobayashii]BDA79339.1 polyisoprenoid-binding protein [Leptospira kobayashii]
MSGLKSIFAVGLVLVSLSGISAQNFKVDNAHSSVGFKIKHLGIATVAGSFKDFDAKFSFDEKTGSLSIVDATIKVESINTNDAKRDDHLKSKDFFDEDKFPTITFKASKPVSLKKGASTKVPGELTIKGVTKPTVLNVKYAGIAKDPWGNTKLGFEADTKIKRADFGITWNKALETGGVLVGEEVDIKIEGEAASAQ